MSILVQRSPAGNSLIAALPRADRVRVVDACEPAELAFGATVYAAGDPITHVYFPTSGYVSLITPPMAAESLEVGMVGSEGVFGITLMLGVRTSPLLCLVQGEGDALRMPSRRFANVMAESGAFRGALNRYLFVLTSQLAQTAACNRSHLLRARTARWLLMTHERAGGDSFRLTHQFLAYMLGVRRSGVTNVAGELQDQGLIRYSRGVVAVLDRAGLQAVSCPCYDAVRATYQKYLGDGAGRAGQRAESKTRRKHPAKAR